MKKLLPTICLFVVTGLISCGGRNLQKQLEEFTRREVAVPGGMRQTIEGRDTVVLNPATGAARIVVWVDSVACSTCRLNKMFEYYEMTDHRKETGEGFVPLFVFSPSRAKIDEMMLMLKFGDFDYPVFIDERQAFSAANPHIPADSRFHTFLLDRNGKVVLVGDPVNNPALWELYKTTITELIGNGGTMPASTPTPPTPTSSPKTSRR